MKVFKPKILFIWTGKYHDGLCVSDFYYAKTIYQARKIFESYYPEFEEIGIFTAKTSLVSYN